MRIDLRDMHREYRFTCEANHVDRPAYASDPSDSAKTHPLQWSDALNEDQQLIGCPVCGCRELFVRRDFPQKLGLFIVILAALIAVVCWAMGQTAIAFLVLAGTVVLDGLILLFTKKCLVCYRCRSEFRNAWIAPDQAGWDLSIGEKYRMVRESSE